MNESELEDLLSTPRDRTVAALRACPGDIVILGAGGKMGPSLSRMARRAADAAGGATCRVIAVSRWSSDAAQRALNDAGVETIRCDLLDRSAAAALDLRFVQVTWEDYDLVLPEDALDAAAPLVTAVRSPAVRAAVEALGGYDTARSGEVVDLDRTS